MNFKESIENIRQQLLRKEISYQEAKVKVTPLVVEFNKKAAEIARKHKRKFRPISIVGIFR
jgi:hypothetical protein